MYRTIKIYWNYIVIVHKNGAGGVHASWQLYLGTCVATGINIFLLPTVQMATERERIGTKIKIQMNE